MIPGILIIKENINIYRIKVNLVDILFFDYYFDSMELNKSIFVFHLRKPDGRGIYLHPFEEFEKMIAKGSTFQVEGKYGDEPVIESITAFRNTLYRIVEESVNNWITESRFIPRFLSSAAFFLFVYFFLSFVIRDPLPMIDEIAGGIGAAVLLYLFLGTKYKKTGTASKMRAHYRGIIDRIVFTQSRFILAFEGVLKEVAGKNIEEMISAVNNSDHFQQLISEESREDLSQFIPYIERGIKKQLSSGQKRALNKILLKGFEKSSSSFKDLDPVSMTGDIDINIIVVYLSLKQVKYQQLV